MVAITIIARGTSNEGKQKTAEQELRDKWLKSRTDETNSVFPKYTGGGGGSWKVGDKNEHLSTAFAVSL